MKKQRLPVLVAVTLLFVGFTLGSFWGQMRRPDPIVLTVPASVQSPPQDTASMPSEEDTPEPTVSFPIDINQAQKEAFMALPGIGEVLAQRILDYRDANGSFTAREDLMNVEGIGEKRMEEIFDLVTIGG